ncbi:MAG: hypothetical protein E2P02_09905 [Acidobacteria bacterium]|nr:MAG: hypothetical protein E2P02_09905 [Acidobacteriota bacterium]
METSESPYRTPTRALVVEIAFDGDRCENVTLFLSTLSETHAGPETLDEALNHERDFLPARSNETEQTILIRRRAIRTVTVSDAVAAQCRAHDEAFSCVDLVRLELVGGETIEGTLATVLSPQKPRLSDYFNSGAADFVPLTVAEGVTFVNRDFISIVWL